MQTDRAPHRPGSLAERLTATALLAVPLYFTVFTSRVFEGDKAGLARWLGAAVFGMLVAAAARERQRSAAGRRATGRSMAVGQPPAAAAEPQEAHGPSGPRVPWTRPLAWALAACLLAEALSTATAVAPWTAVLGSQARGQGLWTALALGGLAWGAARMAAEPGGAGRLARLLAIGALPAGLYALAQGLGLDPLPWEGPEMSRVVGPAGAAPMLAAQLVLALPFAGLMALGAWRAHRLARRRPADRRPPIAGLVAWLATLAVGSGALLLSASRGPILGLAAGLWLLALAACARRGGRAGRAGAAALLLGAALGLAFLAGLNRGAFPRLAALPVLERLATALNPERNSTRARLRLWEGTTLAVGDLAGLPDRRPPARPLPPPWRLLLGYGPESMHLVWAPVYPPLLAYDEPRGYMPDRAHSLFLDALLTGGLLGASAQGLFLGLGLLAALALLGLPRPGRARRRTALACCLPAVLIVLLLPRLDGPWCLARSPWPAGACLLAPGLGLGLLGALGLWLALAPWRGREAGVAVDGWDGAAREDEDDGAARENEDDGAARVGEIAEIDASTGVDGASGFGAAALVALAAHAFELQVSFQTVSSRMLAWAVLGGLAGIGWRLRGSAAAGRAVRARAGEVGRALASEAGCAVGAEGRGASGAEAGLAAGVIGLTTAFTLARPGQVAGGPAVAALLIALGAGLAWRAFRPREAAGEPGGWRLGAGIAGFTVLHLALLDGLAHGSADAVPAAGASLLLYVLALTVLVVRGAGERRDGPVGRAWLVGAMLVLLALPGLAPSLADAWFKEAERGWQAPVSQLRREAKGGKAESYLDRALERYALARRLAPWEPAYALAESRAWVELADLLEARRREAAAGGAEAERSATGGGSPDAAMSNGPATGEARAAPDLGAPAERWAAERDEALRRALAAIDRAELLAPGAPQPAMTRARALRLWGQWSTGTPEGQERLAAARAAYASVMAMAPGWPELQDEAAQTALLAGDAPAALDLALDVALHKDAFYRRAWRTAALAYEALGQPGLASAAYGAYFVDWHNAADLEGLRAWVRVLAATGQTRSALAKAEQAVRLAPGEPATHADLATLQADAGDLPAALTSARRALAISPADAAIQGLVERLAGGAEEAEGAESVP